MTDASAGAERTTVAAASIRLQTPPHAELASSVRELVSTICRELLNPDETQSIAMAAHELVENIVKYSVDGMRSFEVELTARGDQGWVRLLTHNHTVPKYRDDLQGIVERVSRAADPLAIYDELIEASPRREGSGLGLARIRAEAGMNVVCLAEGTLITVIAERRVSIRRAE
jgi:hypothetical protein